MSDRHSAITLKNGAHSGQEARDHGIICGTASIPVKTLHKSRATSWQKQATLVAAGRMAPKTGETAKGELLVVPATTSHSWSPVATAVVAMELKAASTAAIGINPSAIDLKEAANKGVAVCSIAPLWFPAPSEVRQADARLVAETNLAATGRPGRWRQYRFFAPVAEAANEGNQQRLADRLCSGHQRAFRRRGGGGCDGAPVEPTDEAAPATAAVHAKPTDADGTVASKQRRLPTETSSSSLKRPLMSGRRTRRRRW